MKTKLVTVLGVSIVGLLLTFGLVSGVKAAEGDLTYTGVLTAETDTTWTLDTTVFTITPTTIKPPFYAINDTLVTTYTVGTHPDELLAKEFKVLNSGVDNTYTYSGTLMTMDNDKWTVGEYTFLMTGVTLPPLVNINDTVEVTFKIVNGDYVATAVKVTETVVPPKVDTSRCVNRTKDQPAIYKLADELQEDPAKLTSYFCSGFGVGEIRLAYKIADNGYTPAMLLALRASGMGWGEIKQMVAQAPAAPTNPTNNTGSTITSDRTSNANSMVNPGKSNNGNGNGNKPDKDKNKTDHGKKN